MNQGQKTALLLGGTGLVGSMCLNMLNEMPFYHKIIALSRKKIFPPQLKTQNIITDFNNYEELRPHLQAQHVFCALGTTMAKAGSRKAFMHIDYEIPLRVAELAKQNGAEKFILVSAIGANKNSVFFYNRVKGLLEEALEKIGFASLIILQPSLLLGERSERRPAEYLAQKVFAPLTSCFLGKLNVYKPIEATEVAAAMIALAQKNISGCRRYTYSEIVSAARELRP
ncbi:MAG: NAD-dependent epimerase/dehydratase family protein [Chitinophagales bacterium]|nr:NAD-dependent epimerase/dehydratase family protein [Chitinophagales bacterium]MDW8273943.1 NAD-dependent epimerase/dehydratase family protein [Chitinophagales bacterium]